MEILDLNGKKGLVVGIANEDSLAWWAAKHFREAGAELAITYLSDKAKPHVEPLAHRLEAPIFLPCNVNEPGQLEAVFGAIRQQWGRLDFLLHGIAWARKEDLHGRLTDCSAGAVQTRAASGIEHFDELLNKTLRKAPLRRTVEACEVGKAALLLASDYTTAITDEVVHVDAGFHIEGMVFPLSGEPDTRVHDPVCGRQLQLAEVVAMVDHHGWAHFFCSAVCQDAFRAEPDRFADGPHPRRSQGSDDAASPAQ